MDPLGAVFAVLTLIVFISSGIFGLEYMGFVPGAAGHDADKKAKIRRNEGAVFFVLSMIVELLLCMASNMITFYMCYELLTIMSMPLVIHERTHEAKMAALKYLFFSMFGAYFALFGIYNLAKYADSLDFVAGGRLGILTNTSDVRMMLIASMSLIIGFGVKAGMWPMHSWLPTAHPVAPSPASAVLSACIVKAGVLGIIRSFWYLSGTSLIPGTWVQTVWLTLTLITVFLGSLLAYREPLLKKRLAYSTVSQLSYILFGLGIGIGSLGSDGVVSSYLYPSNAITGALLHVLAHGLIKAVLFMCAGAIIHYTGMTKASDLKGMGLKMPVTMTCFTIVSLGLIGIPPTGGFVSKWYLATGALGSNVPVFSWLGPVVLLVSALLTAGYLLVPAVNSFFPGQEYRKEHEGEAKCEPGPLMLIPIATLTLLSVLLGLFPEPLITLLRQIFM